jgi:hypothetical protein
VGRGGIHAPLNNTPQSILDAFLVNDSAYCPSQTVALPTNGCVTFNVGASGVAWPFFLNLIASNLGASVEPCGWYTANGGGVPGFIGTYANANGDGPCWLPGNSTSTQQAGYKNYVSSTPATGWDAFEMEAMNLPAIQPAVQWSDVGSGPYYVENPITPDVGYTLHANPDYAAPVGCAGQPGCMPIKGSYATNVDVVWEASGDTTGLNEMGAGQADSAGFFSTDTSVVQGISDYKLLPGIPAMTIYFDPFNLNFNVSGLEQTDPGGVNVPGTFLQNVALRQFLVNAYPYATIDHENFTVNGTAFGEPYGGAIPHAMGDYYPANVSWPAGDPEPEASEVGNVSWWWAEATNSSSPWYDPQLSNCTVTDPCQWPTVSVPGDSVLNAEFAEWNSEVFNLSGGVLAPYVFDYSPQMVCGFMCPCVLENCFPVYSFGWYADYPDPSDFMAPMYATNNSYPGPDAVSETLGSAPNNASGCPRDYGAWSNLTYWANIGQIPTDCQGAAYDTMSAWISAAEYEPNLPYRTLEYNLIEHIANELALYVYDSQEVTVVDYGDWVEGLTINTNPMNGGEGVQLWYSWGYASNYFAVTFNEAGLTAGTIWSITLAGNTTNATAPDGITFGPFLNGTYQYNVDSVPGQLSSPMGGDVVVEGTNVTQLVVFSCACGPSYMLLFHETGLEPGTAWFVTVDGEYGAATVSGPVATLNASVYAGTYNYTPGAVAGYVTPEPGTVTVQSERTVDISYRSLVQPKFNVTFEETGLPAASPWSIAINGSVLSGTNATIAVGLPNGSYAWGLVSWPAGYPANPMGGVVVVNGTSMNVPLLFVSHSAAQTESPPPWTQLSPLGWVIVGGVVTSAVALGGLLGWLATRKRPGRQVAVEPPSPP